MKAQNARTISSCPALRSMWRADALRKAIGLALSGVLCAAPAAAAEGDSAFAEGRELYDKHCAQCHGVNGDANAPAAPYFKPAPRDFTAGKYKVRSTATGELPTDEDLKNAIKHGLAFRAGAGAYTVMPPWPNLSNQQLDQLVGYIKTFSADFADPEYNNPEVLEIPKPLELNEESIEKGRQVYENNECIKCHGEYGRGDGPSAPTLKDDWDSHIRPADLTKRWTFRAGGTRKDIFRTISTGFNGTPMPSYRDALSVEDRWHLVNYVYSLSRGDTAGYSKPDKPIVAQPMRGSLEFGDFAAARALFDKAEPSYIPLAGQVIEPGRALPPGTTELTVKAVYNDSEIAVMLQWHDLRADVSGKNAPELEVPRFEPKEPQADAAGGEDADPFAGLEDENEEDPFADMEAEGDPFAELVEGAPAQQAAANESEFSDAVAVQLPSAPPNGFIKPYFIFGDSERSVDIWFFDLAKDEPQLYIGRGSGSLTAKESNLQAAAKFEAGLWTAVFKRARSIEGSISFDEKEFTPIGFSVWDGFSEERGNKRALTSWYSIYLEPLDKESALVPMLSYGGGLLLLELLFIGWVRRKNSEQ